jgi:putative transposase
MTSGPGMVSELVECMTAPRQILQGCRYLVTRRCIERRFLMRPSRETNEILLFCLAAAARRHGILVHAYCFLSNHLHLVVSDPMGSLPAFQRYMDSLIARALNSALGRWDHFWEQGSYSGVTLGSPVDALDKMAYTLANPAAAGLVRRSKEWPGVRSTPDQVGAERMIVKRPDRFFRKEGPLPEVVELELTCPGGFESVEDFRQALTRRVEALEDAAARRLGEEGRSFLGVRKVLAQRPRARPALVEPRRDMNPRVACRDRWKRIEALLRLKTFLSDYRAAWCRYARGLRDTIFPVGTYWMKVLHGVPCASAGQ